MHNRFRRTRMACAMLYCTWLPAALAGTGLEELVVTADRQEKSLADTIPSASVYTRVDIERLQPLDLPDLLAHLPGVAITRSGGRGANTSVFIRGTNSNHALVLLDGMRIGSASLGLSQLEYLDPALIERVEVVRGTRSSLYGSDAIGGVIQVFTRRADSGLKPSVSIGQGRFGTGTASASLAGGNDASSGHFTVSRYQTDGIDNLADDSGANADRDAFNNTSFAGGAQHRFDNGVVAGVNHYYSEGQNEFDDDYIDPDFDPVAADLTAEFSLQSTGVFASMPLREGLGIRVEGGHTRNDTTNTDRLGLAFGYPNQFDTERASARAQLNWQPAPAGTLVAGGDFYRDRLDSNEPFAEDSRDNTGVFAQYEHRLGEHLLSGSMRTDDNEQFGQETTGSAAWAWQFQPDVRFSASYASGFKAPTFNDLYWPFAGNPDLEPERSDSVEAELRGKLAAGYWAITTWNTEIDDLINWAPADPNDPLGIWQPDNVDSARIRGAELVLETRLGAWQLGANVGYTDTEDKATGNQLVGRPRESLDIDIDRTLGRVELGASLRVRGERYEDVCNTAHVSGFATVDARLGYLLPEDFRVALALRNIFDQDTRTASRYNSEGFSYLLTLTWQP